MKAEEIQLLEKLLALDGYFANTFTKSDVGIMIGNIKNDFPLLMNTDIDLELNELKAMDLSKTKLENTVKELTDRVSADSDKFELIMASLTGGMDSEDAVYTFFPIGKIVGYKLVTNLELNERDRNFLINAVKNTK